jgi:hypothetical protein
MKITKKAKLQFYMNMQLFDKSHLKLSALEGFTGDQGSACENQLGNKQMISTVGKAALHLSSS